MPKRLLIIVFLFLSATAENSHAWGRDGHAVVGKVAISLLDRETRDWLREIIGNTDNDSLRYACNWPDIVREQPQYNPTRPYHYVNLPRGVDHYLRQRDCRDGRCVTERIKYFAARLDQDQLPVMERIKAFNWLCHLVGDLHQPLHAGFTDDRGGNDFKVKYHGHSMRLHQLWDTAIIRRLHPSWQHLASSIEKGLKNRELELNGWSVESVDQWTNHSHRLVNSGSVYPTGSKRQISRAYEKRASELIIEQLEQAALRLASILTSLRRNTVEVRNE